MLRAPPAPPPHSLRLLCAVFSHLRRLPSEPPLCLSATVPLSLPSLWLVEAEAAGCMGIAPIQVAHPHSEVCLGWSNPRTAPPPSPPKLHHHHFSPSLGLFDVGGEFGSLLKRRRSPGSFDCLAGKMGALWAGRLPLPTDRCTFIAASPIGRPAAPPQLAPPPLSQFPVPSYKFPLAFVFQA